MPLSDDERRRLEKLQDLAAADPDLNLNLGAGSCRDAAARTVCGALTVLGGLMVVIAASYHHSSADRRRCRIPGAVLGAHWALTGIQRNPGPRWGLHTP